MKLSTETAKHETHLQPGNGACVKAATQPCGREPEKSGKPMRQELSGRGSRSRSSCSRPED